MIGKEIHHYKILEKERFLMTKLEEKLTTNQINVITNWFEELKRLAPVKKE